MLGAMENPQIDIADPSPPANALNREDKENPNILAMALTIAIAVPFIISAIFYNAAAKLEWEEICGRQELPTK